MKQSKIDRTIQNDIYGQALRAAVVHGRQGTKILSSVQPLDFNGQDWAKSQSKAKLFIAQMYCKKYTVILPSLPWKR